MVETRLKTAWRKPFLRQLRQGRTVTETHHLLGISRSVVNAEKRRDPGFADEIEAARAEGRSKCILNT